MRYEIWILHKEQKLFGSEFYICVSIFVKNVSRSGHHHRQSMADSSVLSDQNDNANGKDKKLEVNTSGEDVKKEQWNLASLSPPSCLPGFFTRITRPVTQITDFFSLLLRWRCCNITLSIFILCCNIWSQVLHMMTQGSTLAHRVTHRDLGLPPKVGQIGPKWDKSGTF